jgi:hypothetical protein
MSRIRAHLTYANVIATIALFLVLSGGTAIALDGSNTVFTDDIVNGEVLSEDIGGAEVQTGDLGPDAVTTGKINNGDVRSADVLDNNLNGGDIADASVTGADVDESSLAQVPIAALGGFGRSGTGSCDPGADYYTCKFVSLTLPSPSRVLMIASANAHIPSSSDGHGRCLLATDLGNLDQTAMPVMVTNTSLKNAAGEALTMSGVTPPMVGAHDFAIRCNEQYGDLRYGPVQITAVALSAN